MMDQLLTLLLLLGVTLGLALKLRRPAGAPGVSVNWDMSGAVPAETASAHALRRGKALVALLLLTGALVAALLTAAVAARPAHQAGVGPNCVNWNGCPPRAPQGARAVLPVASGPDCVNWNGCPPRM